MFMAVEMSSMEGFPMADKPLKWVRTFLPLAQVPPMTPSKYDAPPRSNARNDWQLEVESTCWAILWSFGHARLVDSLPIVDFIEDLNQLSMSCSQTLSAEPRL